MTTGGWPKLPTWEQIRHALGVKTLYLSLVLFILGIGCILIGASPTFSENPPAVLPTWATITAGLGVTLLTSAIFSFVSETMVRLDTLDFFDAKVQQLASSIPLAPQGPQEVKHLPSRRDFDFANFIRNASGESRIMGFSANDVLSTTNIDEWRNVLMSGQVKKLKVLVIDPTCSTAADRGKAPCYTRPDSFRQKCEASLSEVSDLIRAVQGTAAEGLIDARKLTSNITISLVADGKQVLITPILWTHTGGTSPSFVFANSDQTQREYATYIADFDALWGGGVRLT